MNGLEKGIINKAGPDSIQQIILKLKSVGPGVQGSI